MTENNTDKNMKTNIMKTNIKNIIDYLDKSNLTLSFAESCTGGMLTSMFIDIPGISTYLNEGLVTYSNNSKIKRLGVKASTIEKYGAVSEECVKEMLLGLEDDVSAATSGIAGPSGGSPEKPVGTVYIGVKVKDSMNIVRKLFKGNRLEIRQKSCEETINLLLKQLKKKDSR
ncbi:MAG: CinA family protein [Spirochaetota bacterium]